MLAVVGHRNRGANRATVHACAVEARREAAACYVPVAKGAGISVTGSPFSFLLAVGVLLLRGSKLVDCGAEPRQLVVGTVSRGRCPLLVAAHHQPHHQAHAQRHASRASG
jgi:hypothetical protein